MATRGWELGSPPTGGGYEVSGNGGDRDLYIQESEFSRAMYTNQEIFDLCLEAEPSKILWLLRIWWYQEDLYFDEFQESVEGEEVRKGQPSWTMKIGLAEVV